MGKDRGNLAGKMPRSNAEKLAYANVLRESVLRSVFRVLRLPAGSYGLDAGCGIGIPALWMAEATAPGGRVIGVDLSSEYLTRAGEIARRSALSECVSFTEGDMNRLAFADGTFDWALSIDAVWSERPVRELTRVVRPGGTVAILNWSSQQVLPGYPLLEARLNATPSGIAPFTKGMKPESHVLRALGWLRNAGLAKCRARTFVGDVHAPLSEDTIIAMMSLFEMRWEKAQSELSAADWAEYQRLCQPESPDFILDSPDYYAFFTYSLFYGSKPG
jgi:ubiquinone/menaquinone biosynthesis C-methylase UbiE